MRSLQPFKPLPGILNLSNTRVSVLPEIEEFLVMLYGFGFPAFPFKNLVQQPLLPSYSRIW